MGGYGTCTITHINTPLQKGVILNTTVLPLQLGVIFRPFLKPVPRVIVKIYLMCISTWEREKGKLKFKMHANKKNCISHKKNGCTINRSLFFARQKYFFFDVSLNPWKKVSWTFLFNFFFFINFSSHFNSFISINYNTTWWWRLIQSWLLSMVEGLFTS